MGRPRKQPGQGLPERVYLKSGSYYYVHAEGQRWERLGADLDAAKKVAAQYNSGAGHHPNTFSFWIEQWKKENNARVTAGTLAPRTRDDYAADLVPIEAVFGKMTPGSIQAWHITKYLKIGREAGRPVRANREKAAMSACLSWIISDTELGITINVAKLVRRNHEEKRKRYVSDEEYHAVYAHAGPAERALMELVYRTLQRPSDVLRWTWSSIDANGVLSFKQGKTGALMRIAVTATLRACFDDLAAARKKKSLYLVPREDGRPYTESGISSMLRKAVVAAELKDLALYDMKAKGATDMYQNGTPIEQIQALCGHDKSSTTEIYIKQHMRKVMEPNERKIGKAKAA